MTEKQQVFNTDKELYAGVVKKDKAAFSFLFDKYAKGIFGVIYSITGDAVLSEEILQRAFCMFWNFPGRYEPAKQRLFSWMVKTAGGLAHQSLKMREIQNQPSNNYVDHSKDLINLGPDSGKNT